MDKFKKLSDFFIDQKIDIISKRDATVLTTNGQIMCLPGLRIDNRFKVTVDTKKILEISIC
jgi:tRNA(Ile)-lysidine synthase